MDYDTAKNLVVLARKDYLADESKTARATYLERLLQIIDDCVRTGSQDLASICGYISQSY